jgi:hypothetical protein
VTWLENTWLFPALEALHLVGMAWYVGAIMLAQKPQRAGLWLMLATGVLMFVAGYQRYPSNPAFLVKLALLAALLFVRRPRWLVLSLWVAAILASRAVIDFDA